jgi:S1 RNA binding domain
MMTIETAAVTTSTPALLLDGEFLTGHISKPYIQNEKLLGAILSFDGRGETALLHVKQMSGDAPERLSELGLGDPLLVRIMVQQGGMGRRTVWATEKGVEHQLLVDMFESDPAKFKDIEGRVQGVSEFGVFVDLDGPAKGQRGLLKYSSMSQNAKVKLGQFVAFRVGDPVVCDLAEARLDESSKLLLRLENARPRKAA